jgi:lysyl-tRNA synthetase class 2
MTPTLQKRVPALAFRAKVLSAMRRTFEAQGFLETDTPCAIQAPAAEEYIEAPSAGDFFLRTSPELEMKRLLCAGMEAIYQIGSCFRSGENGRIHRSEFSMLEFYHAHWDYLQLLDFLRNAICKVAMDVNGTTVLQYRGNTIDLAQEWEIISVREAFNRYAPMSADEAAEEESRFEILLTEYVEPNLPKDRASVLIDYPIRFGAFARAKASDPTLAERWEIYIGGVEIANAYGELTDPVIQSSRFRQFAETRAKHQLAEYPQPVDFLYDLQCGMPDSAGAALGFDRLVMLLYGAESLEEIAFPLFPITEE